MTVVGTNTHLIPEIIGGFIALIVIALAIAATTRSSRTRRIRKHHAHPTPLLHEARTRKLIADLRRENRALVRENSRLHAILSRVQQDAPHLNVKRYGPPDA